MKLRVNGHGVTVKTCCDEDTKIDMRPKRLFRVFNEYTEWLVTWSCRVCNKQEEGALE